MRPSHGERGRAPVLSAGPGGLCDQVRAFCTRRGAVYVRTRSADSVEALVLNVLRRTRLLR